jgi:excisionase family DNA binding protein
MPSTATSPRTPPLAPPLAVPTKEASRLLSLSMSRLYELLRSGALQSYVDGYSRRVTIASIQEYVDRRLSLTAPRVAADCARSHRRSRGSGRECAS